ncbi:MAG: DUF3231 family protein [Bacillota bacterium]
MVQVGNFHLGNAGTSKPPTCDILEAGHIWDALVTRYDSIDLTQKALECIHDPDFKIIVHNGLMNVLEKQASIIEKKMNSLQIPMPSRQPKSENSQMESSYTDEYLFRSIFSGIQSMLDAHLRHVRSIITDDDMRHIAMDFLSEEISIFDKLTVYGKMKGWLRVPPKFRS